MQTCNSEVTVSCKKEITLNVHICVCMLSYAYQETIFLFKLESVHRVC